MGHDKDQRIQQDEQGWYFSDNTICYRCVSNTYLRQMVRESADQFECSFCGWVRRQTPNSVALDSLMAVIHGTIYEYYDRADSNLGYSSEDGYFGTTYDTWDLVRDVLPQ
jgi:hypothetical protein